MHLLVLFYTEHATSLEISLSEVALHQNVGRMSGDYHANP
jgi:hypothetical protein